MARSNMRRCLGWSLICNEKTNRFNTEHTEAQRARRNALLTREKTLVDLSFSLCSLCLRVLCVKSVYSKES